LLLLQLLLLQLLLLRQLMFVARLLLRCWRTGTK
jgi:hypothetical protein